MSDLQCAATLLLAAEAETDSTADGSGLSPVGRESARRLGLRLVTQRVATVYAGPRTATVQTAELAAEALRLPVRIQPGLADDLAGELAGIVDLHRGETALVVCGMSVLSDELPRLLANVPDRFGATRPLDHCEVIEVAADADGWVLRSWAGQPA